MILFVHNSDIIYPRISEKIITTTKKPINSMFLGWASDFVVIKYNNAIFAKIQQNQGFQGVVIKTGGISGYIYLILWHIRNMDK